MTTTSSALTKLDSLRLSSMEEATKTNYKQLQRFHNVTSYSILETLNLCPRKVQLLRATAAKGISAENVDFAMGHAVGNGVQAWLLSQSIEAAVFAAFLGWNVDPDEQIEKKNKSLWNAVLAVESYVQFHQEQLTDWELLILPSGRPAIEVAFCIDFENGFKHYGHIDAVLRNRRTGQIAVQENKTHGSNRAEEAIYANSMQAISYAAVVDMLQPDARYEVFYCCYSTPSREWELLPFQKTTANKAEALLDIQLSQAALTTYNKLNFYPKRGANCFAFMRRCQFFGECDMVETLPPAILLPKGEDAETVDFAFTLSQLKQTQLRKLNHDTQ